MSGALTLSFTAQASSDIRRMTQELADLQRQVASGDKHNDLRGFGGGASRLISSQGLKAAADARASSVNQLQARFGVQAAALSQAATASDDLAQSIRDAISANDGRAVSTDLQLTFSSVISALNETWNGQPLFAGERLNGGGPIRIGSIDDLIASTTPEDIFNEAERPQVIDLGGGVSIPLASKASEMATGLFETLRSLALMVQGVGGELPAPMSQDQINTLQNFANDLESHARSFTVAEGRAGQLQKRFEYEQVRLQDRSNLLLKEIGQQTDADMAEISIRISSLMSQYQAAAKTFGDLSKLTLLDYL